jgi:N utilization substance protein A
VSTITQQIEMLSKEKGIDSRIVIDALKDAMVVAARKHYKTTDNLVAELDGPGGIQIFSSRKVVETVADPVMEISLAEAQRKQPGIQVDDELRIPLAVEGLGRIAAQTAKQVMLQKVREAERETIFGEFNGRVGELVNTVVKRIELQDIVVDLGKTEARLTKREQSRSESYSIGDRIRVVIRSVEKQGRNAGVIVSRAAPELVMRLFEQEVPEIYDGTVVIKGCAREAGERTKIAVFSRDRDVDCVGACVGMKGMRVQSIIRELRGEKIDIIEYDEDNVRYAMNALSPAKITRVNIVNLEDRHMEVIVDDSQLSLAIGKKGQNVRLAAKLMGWRIDIKSEEEKRQEVDTAMALLNTGSPVSTLIDYGLPEEIVEHLVAGGIGTIERVGEMTPEELEQLPNIGPDEVQKLQVAVMSFYGQYPEEGAPEEAVSEDAVAGDAVAGGLAEEPAPEESPVEESPEDESPVEESPVDESPVEESAVAAPPVEPEEGAGSPSAESDTIERIEGLSN